MEDANLAKKKWLEGLKAAEEEFMRLHPEEYQEYERITSADDEASEAIDASRKEMIELRVKSEMPQEYETLQQLSGSERDAYLESLGQQMQRQVSLHLIKPVVDEAVRVLCPVMTGDFAKEMMELSSIGGISNLVTLLKNTRWQSRRSRRPQIKKSQ
jgi:hypothetical protein